MANRSPKRNITLAVLVVTIALAICYIKLKYFLRPKEEIYKQPPPTKSVDSANSHTSTGGPAVRPIDATVTLKGTVHIAISADSKNFPAIPTLLNSLRQHCPSKTVVHIVATEKITELRSLVSCCKVDQDIEVDIKEFSLPKEFKEIVTVLSPTSLYGNLSSGGNFVRFFLHKLFPTVTHILYLDVDNLVQHDISSLWREIIDGDQLITSTTIPNRNYGSYLKPLVKKIFDKRHSNSLNLSTPCIIGGMYGVNLELWRTLDIHKEVMFWMNEHHKHHLWSLGSQPLLMLVAYGRLKVVSRRWNLTGLGWNTKYNPEELKDSYILHWNGIHKPWLKDGLYKDTWDYYTPELFESCINL